MTEQKSERERKREQRAKWKAEGWTFLHLRVAKEQADKVRDFAASLPPPREAPHPGQQPLPIFEGEDNE